MYKNYNLFLKDVTNVKQWPYLMKGLWNFTLFHQDENRTLSDLLNNYTFNMDTDQMDGGGEEEEEDDHYLEESWTEVITVHEGMTNREKIQQETIWELLITERNYLRKIRVIIVVSALFWSVNYSS